MLQDPPHLLETHSSPLEQARLYLEQMLSRQAIDFLPSTWALVCRSEQDNIGQIIPRYFAECGLRHTVYDTVQLHERQHLPDHCVCITALGRIELIQSVPERPEHWPLVKAIHLEQNPTQKGSTKSADNRTQDLLQFWKSLRNSDWLSTSISSSLKDIRPVVYASVLINLLALAPAFFSIQVYDRIIPNSAYSSLAALLLGVLMCLGFEHVLKHARHRLMEHAATVADTQCARQLSMALLNVRTNQTEPAVLLQHLRSFEQLREIITGVFLLALIDLPFLGIFLLVIAIIHPLFLVIAGGAIALTLASIVMSHRKMAAQSKQQMLAYRNSQNQWLDALANLELIQTTGVQSPYSDSLNKAQLESRVESNTVRSLLFDAGQHIHILQQASWILSVALGVYLVVNQQLSVGGLIAVSMLTMRCFGPIQKLQSHLMQTHSAQASFEDLDRFLGKPSRSIGNPQKLDSMNALDLEHASVVKPGKPANSTLQSDHILIDVSLRIEGGARLGVIGPMGSGKTSLLKLLARQLDLNRGGFRVNQIDHSHYSTTEYAKNLGVAMQPPLLIKGSLLDNIQFRRPWVSVQDCMKALQQIGMLDWVNTHPDGLHMHIESQGSNLSAGQRQTVSLARALAGKPTLLLLDEPTVCLDQHAENHLIESLQNLPSDVTLVLTTHKLNLLGTCKQLCLINDGQMVAHGDKTTVMQAASELMKKRDTESKKVGP